MVDATDGATTRSTAHGPGSGTLRSNFEQHYARAAGPLGGAGGYCKAAGIAGKQANGASSPASARQRLQSVSDQVPVARTELGAHSGPAHSSGELGM